MFPLLVDLESAAPPPQQYGSSGVLFGSFNVKFLLFLTNGILLKMLSYISQVTSIKESSKLSILNIVGCCCLRDGFPVPMLVALCLLQGQVIKEETK